jgi:hypothetical protein
MNTNAIRNTFRAIAACGAIIVLTIGCNKKDDNAINFTRAIDTYYDAHPACLWANPVKFPV